MGKKLNFEVIVGTYEEYLLGYYFSTKEGRLSQSFASHDHTSSIRTVAVCDQYLASGAADDRIIIYDLKTRKELSMLTHHDSTITALDFTNNHSHIISGSSDGVLAIVRVGNWQVEKKWDKAHGGSPIHSIAVHSTGKLALTLGGDGTLRTWNLVKGRPAYTINLNTKCKDAKALEHIVWGPDSVKFLLFGGKYTEIWSIETGGMLKVFEHNEKVTSGIWLGNDRVLFGHENGKVTEIDIESGERVTHDVYDSRIKCLAQYKKWIVTACSNGEIKIFDKELNELAKVNVGCRITCITVSPCYAVAKEETEENTEEAAEVSEDLTSKSTKRAFGSVVIQIEDEDDTVCKFKKRKRKKDISMEDKSSKVLNKSKNICPEKPKKNKKLFHK